MYYTISGQPLHAFEFAAKIKRNKISGKNTFTKGTQFTIATGWLQRILTRGSDDNCEPEKPLALPGYWAGKKFDVSEST